MAVPLSHASEEVSSPPKARAAIRAAAPVDHRHRRRAGDELVACGAIGRV